MGNCKFRHFTKEGELKDYTCEDIETLKSEFRKINRTDDVLKTRRDLAYERFCEQLDSFCKCPKL